MNGKIQNLNPSANIAVTQGSDGNITFSLQNDVLTGLNNTFRSCLPSATYNTFKTNLLNTTITNYINTFLKLTDFGKRHIVFYFNFFMYK